MKKFLMGVFAALGTILVGKNIYRKGYNDGVEGIRDDFELIKTGMDYKNSEDDKTSKTTNKKETK